MLKLSFSTLPCSGWSIEQVLEYARLFSYSGIEIREGEDSPYSVSMDSNKLKALSGFIKASGIEVTNLGSGICIKGNSKDTPQLELFKKFVQDASELSAKGIRIFLGNFAKKHSDPKTELNEDRIIEWVQAACDYASAYPVQLWIETHNEYATGNTLQKLLTKINRINCKIIWDILHPLEDGETPEETMEFLGDSCVHIHIKDGVPFEDPDMHDWKYTFPGKGKVPIEETVRILKSRGFEGYYSLEWESKWRQELQVPGAEPELILPLYSKFMNALFQEEKP